MSKVGKKNFNCEFFLKNNFYVQVLPPRVEHNPFMVRGIDGNRIIVKVNDETVTCDTSTDIFDRLKTKLGQTFTGTFVNGHLKDIQVKFSFQKNTRVLLV